MVFRSSKEPAEVDVKHMVAVNDRAANVAAEFPTNYFKTTKYTLLTFLPLSLFQQFKRWANFYFLFSAVITLIPGVSPISPAASIGPLLFVLGVSCIKEAIEDYRRYKEDMRVNSIPYEVLVNGKFMTLPSRDIQPGDIVKIANNSMMPADLVVLNTGLPEGACYVNTANLDGETNLKLRKSMAQTTMLQPHEFRGSIECEAPNASLYEFSGKLTLPAGLLKPEDGGNPNTSAATTVSLCEKQLLLRGANLKNTPFAYGCVVYAGSHTKMFRNLKASSSKLSRLELMLNKMIIVVFIMHVSCVLTSALFAGVYQGELIRDWYLDTAQAAASFGAQSILTYTVLYNTMIPISLYVSIEIVRVAQAMFMEWDIKLVSFPGTRDEQALIVRNSSVNEELGQVSHIFTDKTGTLTQNLMKFHSCSVGGTVFDESEKIGQLGRNLFAGTNEAPAIREFLLNMALNHGVVPNVDEKTGERVYESQSPDEVALVQASAQNQFVLESRTSERNTDLLTISIRGERFVYRVTDVLDFTSDRKRMSVIIECPDGTLKLYTKGADDIMFPRCVPNPIFHETMRTHLAMFSKKGFRTLVYGEREVGIEEAAVWRAEYKDANELVGPERAKQVAEVCDKLEHSLRMTACSAVEDKLQDKVPETLAYLLEAGLNIWVLTGDKQETAINIGLTSKLLTDEMEIIKLNAADSKEQCADALTKALAEYVDSGATERKKHGLVIDGATLHKCMDPLPRPKGAPRTSVRPENPLMGDLYRLASSCASVVCCRVTPLQKANVVRMVKKRAGSMCLSIGDGANDVSMIKEAHVGVGVMGREGTQAARAADYAIGEFRHLRRLVTVHGRYSYLRMASFVQYFLYKNLTFTLCQLWWAIFSAFSGQTLYDQWVIAMYNIIFTGLPPLFMGIFEKDVDDRIIATYPQLFQRNMGGLLFNWSTFSKWILLSIYSSLVIFFCHYGLMQNDILFSHGNGVGNFFFGCMCSTTAVIVVNLKLALNTRSWTLPNHLAIWGSIAAYFITLFVYSSVKALPDFYMVFFEVLESPSFYWALFLAVTLCLAPDFAMKYWQRQYTPKDWQHYQERETESKANKSRNAIMTRRTSVKYEENVMNESLLKSNA